MVDRGERSCVDELATEGFSAVRDEECDRLGGGN